MLDAPGRDMRNLDAHEVGPISRAGWTSSAAGGGGIQQLGEFAGSAVTALDTIADAFREADTDLAGALNDAMEG